MGNLPLHPALVHLPLGLAVVLPLTALGLAVALWRGWLPARSWTVVVALQALLVVSGAVAMRTGEGDEEKVERIVAEAAIEAHENAAKVFVGAAGLTLALAIAALALARKPALARAATFATAALTVAVLGLGLNVGHKGGTLVYEKGAAGAWTQGGLPGAGTASEQPKHGGGERDDDDD